MDLTDKILEHFTRLVKVRDNTLFEGPHRIYIGRGPAEHLLRLCADRYYLVILDRYNRRLVTDNSLPLCKYQCIRRAEIYCKII